jgi:hypothetical protein
MTPHQLSKRLSEFGIKPNTIRIVHRTAKGYQREQFAEAFKRYLSATTPQTSVTPSQPSNHGACSDFAKVTKPATVTDQNGLKPSNHGGCDVVTDKNTLAAAKGQTHNETPAFDESDMEAF